MMLTSAVHGVTSSSTHQFRIACLFHSLHGTHDFSHAINSYQCAWFAHFCHDLPFVEGLPPIGYIVNLLIPPGADCHYPDVALSLVDANLTPPFCALNQNLLLISSSRFLQMTPIVRTSFDLNPEQEWTQAQKARTINLQRVREKSQSESRIKILVYSVKRKELHAHICNKYPRICPSTMIKSAKLFLFTVVFLQPFALSLSLSFSQSFSSCPPFFESFFVLYTMFFTPFPPSTCGSGVENLFSLFSLTSP